MSAAFWDARYRDGGNSGDGSVGLNAQFKAQVVNAFVAAQPIDSVIEFGCGDGRQLALMKYPDVYWGLDVSEEAIRICREKFKGDTGKSFHVVHPGIVHAVTDFDLALSLDVIYHLTEDDAYFDHLNSLFSAATRFVLLYTSDVHYDPFFATGPHVLHRPVNHDIANLYPEWRFVRGIRNPYDLEAADFYLYAPR